MRLSQFVAGAAAFISLAGCNLNPQESGVPVSTGGGDTSASSVVNKQRADLADLQTAFTAKFTAQYKENSRVSPQDIKTIAQAAAGLAAAMELRSEQISGGIRTVDTVPFNNYREGRYIILKTGKNLFV